MGERLKGKAAVVTGSGRGIGRAVALALAAEGAQLVINDAGVALDGSGGEMTPADQVVAQIRQAGGQAVANYDSVALYENGEKIVKTCVDTFGKIDILCNVAGILRDRMIFNMTKEEWYDVINVHLNGTFNCTKFASILMRQQRSGRIINFTSSAALGTSGHANYGAAKAAIIGFTLAVARDVGSYGVTCNVIMPGALTRMTESVPENVAAIRAARGVVMHAAGGAPEAPRRPTGPMGPEYVPPLVVWLCTNAGANINSQILGAQGGVVELYAQPEVWRCIHKDPSKGPWTLDELEGLMPISIAKELT